MSEPRNVKRSSIVLGVVAASAGFYELFAIITDWVPTITEMVLDIPLIPRALLVLVAVIATVDHFLVRRYL